MEFDALNILIRLLNSNSETLKKYATKSLIKRGSTAVAPLIREMKNNKEISIDIAAILVKIGTPSIEPLKELLLEKDTELVLIAKAALYELGVNLKPEPEKRPEPVEKIKKETQEESWEESIMRCIQGLEEFSLQDIYSYREELARLHPKNRNIEAKIRQQLQLLRDKGVIELLGKGRYRVVTPESARKVLVIQVDPWDPHISNINVGDNITLSIEEYIDNIKKGNMAVLCSVEKNGEILMHGISEVISELGNGVGVGKTGKGMQLKLRIKEKLGGIPIAASQIKDQGIEALNASKLPKGSASVSISMLTYDEWSKIARIIQDSALISAARSGNIDAAKRWIESDANSALKWVAEREDLKTLQVLVAAGIDMNAALATIIKEGNIEVIKPIIQNGISTDYRNRNGWTALMKAAANGQTETARSLIETGASIDAKNGDGWTALMLASNRGYADTVKILIDAGADIDAKNRYGFTAAMIAALRGFIEVTKILTEAGAHIDEALIDIAGIDEIEAITADENGKSDHDLEQPPTMKSNSEVPTDEIILSPEEDDGVIADGSVIDKGDNEDKQDDAKDWKDIVQIAAGFEHTVGLKKDGSVVATGDNEKGQCNVSSWADIVQVAAGSFHTVGLKKDGSVVATGSNGYGQCNVEEWRDIVQVAAGSFHTVGLKKDGSVVATGYNEDGQCDVSSWSNIVQVAAGSFHTVGLKKDGSVVATGYNEDGQCDVSSWSNIVKITAGRFHTVGLKKDGSVVAVGYDGNTQCNVEEWRDIVQIAAGDYHTVGLKKDGSVVAVGDNEKDQCNVSSWSNIVKITAGRFHTVGLKKDGSVVAVGDNEKGQCDFKGWAEMIEAIANDETIVSPENDDSVIADGSVIDKGDNEDKQDDAKDWKDIVQIAAGFEHTVGLKKDGSVVAVGYDYWGQCNVEDWKDIVQIAAGFEHTVGLKKDGSVVAVGSNGYGQCNVEEWKDIVQIAAGLWYTVGLKKDGSVVAVGSNGYDQCDFKEWRNIAQIAAGFEHTVGLKKDGSVVAVGSNEKGQCNVSIWANIVQISAGGNHTVGLKKDGSVVAVGNNSWGQCNVEEWKDIVQISAGGNHTVGLKKDGSVVAVGNNEYGQCDFKKGTEMIEAIANDEILGDSDKLNMVDIKDLIKNEEKIERFPAMIEKNFGSNAVKDLLRWLSDPEWRVRWVAVKALEMTAPSLSYEERENIERRLNDAIKEENNAIVKSTLIDVCGKIAPFEPEVIKANTEEEVEMEGALKSAIESCATLKGVWKDDRVNHEKRILEEKFNEEIKYIGVNANVFVSTKPKHKHFAVFPDGDRYSIVLFAVEPMSFKNGLVTSFKGRADNELHRALMDAIEEIRRKTNPAVIPAKTKSAKKPAQKTRSKSDKEMPEVFNKMMNSESTEELINGLAHEDEGVREAAAIRLAELKDPRAIDYLSMCLLRDPSARVRKSCAMALGEIGGSRAISALSEASNDSDTAVKERALKSLQNIGGECVIDGISRFLRDKERNIRFFAVSAIGSIEGASSIEVLQRFLTYEDDPSLRKLATDCINKMRRQR